MVALFPRPGRKKRVICWPHFHFHSFWDFIQQHEQSQLSFRCLFRAVRTNPIALFEAMMTHSWGFRTRKGRYFLLKFKIVHCSKILLGVTLWTAMEWRNRSNCQVHGLILAKEKKMPRNFSPTGRISTNKWEIGTEIVLFSFLFWQPFSLDHSAGEVVPALFKRVYLKGLSLSQMRKGKHFCCHQWRVRVKRPRFVPESWSKELCSVSLAFYIWQRFNWICFMFCTEKRGTGIQHLLLCWWFLFLNWAKNKRAKNCFCPTFCLFLSRALENWKEAQLLLNNHKTMLKLFKETKNQNLTWPCARTKGGFTFQASF